MDTDRFASVTRRGARISAGGVEVRHYPICWEHGERPWSVPARALDVRCDTCGQLLDTFQPRIVRVGAPWSV